MSGKLRTLLKRAARDHVGQTTFHCRPDLTTALNSTRGSQLFLVEFRTHGSRREAQGMMIITSVT